MAAPRSLLLRCFPCVPFAVSVSATVLPGSRRSPNQGPTQTLIYVQNIPEKQAVEAGRRPESDIMSNCDYEVRMVGKAVCSPLS